MPTSNFFFALGVQVCNICCCDKKNIFFHVEGVRAEHAGVQLFFYTQCLSTNMCWCDKKIKKNSIRQTAPKHVDASNFFSRLWWMCGCQHVLVCNKKIIFMLGRCAPNMSASNFFSHLVPGCQHVLVQQKIIFHTGGPHQTHQCPTFFRLCKVHVCVSICIDVTKYFFMLRVPHQNMSALNFFFFRLCEVCAPTHVGV